MKEKKNNETLKTEIETFWNICRKPKTTRQDKSRKVRQGKARQDKTKKKIK